MNHNLLYTLTVCLLIFLLTCIAVFVVRGQCRKAPLVVRNSQSSNVQPGTYTVTQIPVMAVNASSLNSRYPTQTYNLAYPSQQAQPVPIPISAPMERPTVGYNPSVPMLPPQHTAAFPAMQSIPLPQGNINPPPYDLAVAGTTSGHISNVAGYEKQAPYNPHFRA